MANGISQPVIAVGSGDGVVSGGGGNDILMAEPQVFTALFPAGTGSGVSGNVQVSVEGDLLQVTADFSGLEPGQVQDIHLHGLTGSDDTPLDSAPPAIGPVLLDLGSATAASDGSVHLEQSLSLDAVPGLTNGASIADLFPLDFRAVEIHGGGASAAAPLQAEAGTAPATTSVTETGAHLLGGDGADRLVGGSGDDVLVGGRGDDVLAGGQGSDDLVGGGGADRFLVGQGKDVITDFDAAAGDRLAFGNVGSAASLVVHDTNQGAWIIVGTGAVEDPASQGVLLLDVHVNAPGDVAGWFA